MTNCLTDAVDLASILSNQPFDGWYHAVVDRGAVVSENPSRSPEFLSRHYICSECGEPIEGASYDHAPGCSFNPFTLGPSLLDELLMDDGAERPDVSLMARDVL